MTMIMRSLPPVRVPAIHLAGTNGKGSVSAILESCLREAGLRTARYNSPHLLEPRDALRLDGILPPAQRQGLKATTFEIATAAAYFLINEFKPDVMIIECGMGGAGDATNVIPAELTLASALTSIGLDHTAFLGDSIAAITEVKARIAVSGGLLCVASQPHHGALGVARQVARERGARVVEARRSIELPKPRTMSLRPFVEPPATLVETSLGHSNISTSLSLPGTHQLDNLSLALTVLHEVRQDPRALSIQPRLAYISDNALRSGVAKTRWAGRCSWVQCKNVPILVDGAHNEDSARTLRQYIDSLVIEHRRPTTFIVSLSHSQGKTVESVLRPLLRPGDSVAIVDFSTPVEGMPWIQPVRKEVVRDAATSMVGNRVWMAQGTGPRALQDALRWATADWAEKGPGLVVVCGSLYLVADLYRLLRFV